MIGEVSQMQDENGKFIFGILIDVDNNGTGKRFIPCNQLLWETKKRELQNVPLMPQKVEIRFIKD